MAKKDNLCVGCGRLVPTDEQTPVADRIMCKSCLAATDNLKTYWAKDWPRPERDA